MNRFVSILTMDPTRIIGLGLGWLGLGLLGLTLAACQEQPYQVCDTELVCRLGYECSPRGDFCALRNGCGNGRIDPGEVCDDGNRVSGDGCSQDCTSDESCGNGNRDRWESCDDGNRLPEDGCSRICQLEHCGNGELDQWEICDDGSSANGDGCSADCLSLEVCGNGYIDIYYGESCDDSNIEDGDGCSADCIDENCGNSVVDPGEYCDDGNTANGDGCSADCKSDERCGNGIVDFSIGEHCDDGNARDGDGCNMDCWRSTCGNSMLELGEACDDGNTANGDGCNADCLHDEFCGNSALDPGEMCDPESGSSCNADCSSDQACGNHYNDLITEQCDDRGDSRYCDFDCTVAWCGDGVANAMASERCDDGNDFDDDGCTNTCTGPHLWSRAFGSAGLDVVTSIALDSAGNIILAGGFHNTIDFGGGPLVSSGGRDTFVVKLNAARQHLWSRSFGGMNDDDAHTIAVDSAGNVLLSGHFQDTIDSGGGPLSSVGGYDVFVVKLDPTGQHLWSRSFGGPGHDVGQAISVDNADNILLFGSFVVTINFGGVPLTGAGANDLFATKLNAAGQHVWSRSFGGTNDDYAQAMAADNAGNVVLTARFRDTIQFDGGSLSSAGDHDIFVLSLDSAGRTRWYRRFGGTGIDVPQAVAVDSVGKVLLTGYFEGTTDFGGGRLSSTGGDDIFIVALDAAGQHQWSRRFGGIGFEWGLAIVADSANNVLVSGRFEQMVIWGDSLLSSAGSHDMFIVKLDVAGQLLWKRRFGGTDVDEARAIALDSADNVLVTGLFYGTSEFGGGPFSSAGDGDVFILAVAP